MLLDKNFTTIEKQIEILDKRKLNFSNKETAYKLLMRYGYYNIINGYKDPYIVIENGNEEYKPGITFEQIYSLYCMDRKLRTHIMEAMLEVEDNLRTALAHTIGESFTAEDSIYLNKENYRTGKSRNGVFQRDEILKKFNLIQNDDSQPIKHYRETYGNIPPWILLKKASFGNLVNFTKLLKSPQKNNVISIMYGLPASLIAESQILKNLFMDTLFVCLDYRNIVAHGGRVYNHIPKSTFRYNPLIHKANQISKTQYDGLENKASIPVLIRALSFMDNRSPGATIQTATTLFMEQHCKLYERDKSYLQDFLLQ